MQMLNPGATGSLMPDPIHRLLPLCVLLSMTAACSEGPSTGDDVAAAPSPAAETPAATENDGPDVDDDPRRAVVSDRLPYGEVGNELVYGHFAFPADMVEPLPAVVIMHDRWGLNDGLKAMADRLAGEGYIVLAVDLFGGEVATDVQSARLLMQDTIENPEESVANLEAALDFLKSVAGAPSLASLGMGFGGSWDLNPAVIFADRVDASVSYYGQVSDNPERLEPIQVPVLGLFGGSDRIIPPEDVTAFEVKMRELDKDLTIHMYEGAGHGFANQMTNRYSPDEAQDAWEKTLAFLAEHLSSTEESAN